MTDRFCVGCRKTKDTKELIRITNAKTGVIINPNSVTFGRSAYICYNKTCIENALKQNRLAKCLKTSIPNELKGQLLDELRNN